MTMPLINRLQANRGVKLGFKQIRLPFWNTQGKTFKTDPSKNSKELAVLFSKGKKQEPVGGYVLKAREALISITILNMHLLRFGRPLK